MPAAGSPRSRIGGGPAALAAQLPDVSRLTPAQLSTLMGDEQEFKNLLRTVVASSQVSWHLAPCIPQHHMLAVAQHLGCQRLNQSSSVTHHCRWRRLWRTFE